jgi:hypothetical protein
MGWTNVTSLTKIWQKQAKTSLGFQQLAVAYPTVQAGVVKKYTDIKISETIDKDAQTAFNNYLNSYNNGTLSLTSEETKKLASAVWSKKRTEVGALIGLSAEKQIALLNSQLFKGTTRLSENAISELPDKKPFDRRLDRYEIYIGGKENLVVPLNTAQADVATSGYLMSSVTLNAIDDKVLTNKQEFVDRREILYKQMEHDEMYYGVPALQNSYALINLYGSKAGSLLINEKNKRRWYEIDVAQDSFGTPVYNFASTPTTSAIIDWGKGDPYGRTPYHFTDFVFSKYWKKIENNRMITLRRYPAPMYDNLRFPGMGGSTDNKEITTLPPMASAVTYFGGDTENSISSILKFTTGYNWGEVQGDVWGVTVEGGVPDNMAGIGKLFGGTIGALAEMLNVATGRFTPAFIANEGQLPPDPYQDGPFENRIQGPVNRIDKVAKRDPGLKFQMDGLKLVFEYVARPIGGINTKAILLDILSNFLVIGSASAVFFGGAHRFMADPAKYPFIGGDNTMEKLYTGNVIGYSADVLTSFVGKGGLLGDAFGDIWNDMKGAALDALRSILHMDGTGALNSVKSLIAGDNNTKGVLGNFIKNKVAKSAGHVPYLKGMKAILTGEPVGEWHVTIGNPLNPIAMIGNLICDDINVEFNEELGPDDFPTEMKITVNLKHAMARDKDAIESIFNRGMGRIYNLPDSFLGSGDYQTSVDKNTQGKYKTGTMPGGAAGFYYRRGMDSRAVSAKEMNGSSLSNHGVTSVWDRYAFHVGISENSRIDDIKNSDIFKSAYRTADWVAQRALL